MLKKTLAMKVLEGKRVPFEKVGVDDLVKVTKAHFVEVTDA